MHKSPTGEIKSSQYRKALTPQNLHLSSFKKKPNVIWRKQERDEAPAGQQASERPKAKLSRRALELPGRAVAPAIVVIAQATYDHQKPGRSTLSLRDYRDTGLFTHNQESRCPRTNSCGASSAPPPARNSMQSSRTGQCERQAGADPKTERDREADSKLAIKRSQSPEDESIGRVKRTR